MITLLGADVLGLGDGTVLGTADEPLQFPFPKQGPLEPEAQICSCGAFEMEGTVMHSTNCVVAACLEALWKGNKILVCGNGGSATQASHFAAELIVRYKRDRRAIPCIALTADQAVITACANDYGYERVFERQVEALGRRGDVLITISTSGRSANVLKAADMALTLGMTAISAPIRGASVAERQEHHMRWLHDLAERIENHIDAPDTQLHFRTVSP